MEISFLTFQIGNYINSILSTNEKSKEMKRFFDSDDKKKKKTMYNNNK